MLYAIFCYDSEAEVFGWSEARDAEVMASLDAVQEPLKAEGRLGPVARLAPTAKARTIRKSKEAMILDGPFAETKEQLGGYHLVECKDRDEAISIATRIPTLSVGGTIEVRAVMPSSETFSAS